MNCSFWKKSKSENSLVNVFLNHPTFQTAPQAILAKVLKISPREILGRKERGEPSASYWTTKKVHILLETPNIKAQFFTALCSLRKEISRGIMEFPLLGIIFLWMLFAVPSCGRFFYTPPSVPRLTDLVPHVSIDQCFAKMFGASNIQLMNNGSSLNLTLDKVSGKKIPFWSLAFLLVWLHFHS